MTQIDPDVQNARNYLKTIRAKIDSETRGSSSTRPSPFAPTPPGSQPLPPPQVGGDHAGSSSLHQYVSGSMPPEVTAGGGLREYSSTIGKLEELIRAENEGKRRKHHKKHKKKRSRDDDSDDDDDGERKHKKKKKVSGRAYRLVLILVGLRGPLTAALCRFSCHVSRRRGRRRTRRRGGGRTIAAGRAAAAAGTRAGRGPAATTTGQGRRQTSPHKAAEGRHRTPYWRGR